MTLRDILALMLKAETRQVHKLRGGLTLISYPPDNNTQRLHVLRQGAEPSEKELSVVRRELLDITQHQPLTTISEAVRQPPQKGWNSFLLTILRPPTTDTSDYN